MTDDFELRVKKSFLRDVGKPLVKGKILPCCEEGRPTFARDYSYSIINFAMRVFYLEEEEYYEEANNALIENCKLYISDKACRDDRDSFYWSIDVFCRIVELFGSNGTICKSRLSLDAENSFLEMAYCWCKNNSDLKRAGINDTWNIWESENHHVQGFSTCWHLSKILMNDSYYKDKPYNDKKKPVEHFSTWNKYIKYWISERGKKSLFVENANGNYGTETLKGIYNIYDFSDDLETKRLAKAIIDLYWALWAQEQINGVRGGGKSRIYPEWLKEGRDGLRNWCRYYFDLGETYPASANDYTIMTSHYRVPDIIKKLASGKKGTYEIKSRPLGLAKKGFYINPDYHLRSDWGGILRYTYCTPHFMCGTLITEARPFEDWTLISSQNRFQGSIFSSAEDARIVPVPQCLPDKGTTILRSYNQFYSSQNKGTIITQKIPYSNNVGEMSVWFSKAGGLNELTEENGWIFTRTDGAYAAVKIVNGGYKIKKSEESGTWVICDNDRTPIILETVEANSSFESFKAKILALDLIMHDNELIYHSYYGDKFRFSVNYNFLPEINGKVNLEKISESFKSPFINELWNDGKVVITYKEDKLSLDFTVKEHEGYK